MSIFYIAERFMVMDDAVWARHANPLSAASRISVLPLLALAIWSRVWLGWGALVPIILALGWMWWNPRAFGPPAHLDSWFSRGVLGERVFLTYPKEVPKGHYDAAHLLTWATFPGVFLMVWGLWALWWEGVVFGIALTCAFKLWFMDRMVWMLQDWRRSGGAVPGES